MDQQREEIEIDLMELIFECKKNKWFIIATTLLLGAAAWFVSSFLMSPSYSGTAKIYVMSNSENTTISISDLNVSTGLTSDYMELIKSRPVMEQVIENLNLDMGYKELLECVSVSNPDDTRILYITVTYSDAVFAKEIANNIMKVAVKSIASIRDTDEPSVVESAILSEDKIAPSTKKYMILAALLGFIASTGGVLLVHLFDDRVKTAEDVEQYLGLTILGMVPIDQEAGRE